MKLIDPSGSIIPLEKLNLHRNLAIYPGSYNPLHKGHKGIYELLQRLGYHTVFEISKSRFKKPPYSEKQMALLTSQFRNYADLLISDAPLFSQKRDQLARFNPFWVMGYDTAKRWIEENKKVDQVELKKISAMKVIFIGRLSDGVYYDPTDLITGSETYQYKIYHFKCDISSTLIRRENVKSI